MLNIYSMASDNFVNFKHFISSLYILCCIYFCLFERAHYWVSINISHITQQDTILRECKILIGTDIRHQIKTSLVITSACVPCTNIAYFPVSVYDNDCVKAMVVPVSRVKLLLVFSHWPQYSMRGAINCT